MAREERLRKLQLHAALRPAAEGRRGHPRSFREITQTPIFTKPMRLAEVLAQRGQRYCEGSRPQ